MLKDGFRFLVMVGCLVLAVAVSIFLGYFLGAYSVLSHFTEPTVPVIEPNLLSVIGALI